MRLTDIDIRLPGILPLLFLRQFYIMKLEITQRTSDRSPPSETLTSKEFQPIIEFLKNISIK